MFLILLAALVGGASSFGMLLSFGIGAACLGAPVGGSLAALAAALLVAAIRTDERPDTYRTAGWAGTGAPVSASTPGAVKL